jgi:CBS domain containing-hemolysin-like protein
MILTLTGVLLILLGLLALALQRFYSSIPAHELKRLAARGDHLAAALFRPVAYGQSMRVLLWTIFGLGFSCGVLFVTLGLVAPLAFIIISWAVVGMIFLLSIRLTVHSAKIAVHAAPALTWLLRYLHKPLDIIAKGFNHLREHEPHTGLYEKEDLFSLLRQQKDQLDNRIAAHELDILERAIQVDERQAADALLPMDKAKMVRMDDHIGPVLLKELHDSGQNSFLVYEDSHEHVIGTLFLRDAIQAKEGGRVRDLVRPRLVFVHEDFTLRQVLQAFIRTNQFMVVVINSFEEAVGVITLDHLLTELIGVGADETMNYEDRIAIAGFKPEPRTEKEQEPEAETGPAPSSSLQLVPVPVDNRDGEPSSPERTEVVE